MGRVTTKDMCSVFWSAWKQIPGDTQCYLTVELAIDGLSEYRVIILYYMPALFAKVLSLTADCPRDKKVNAIACLMMLMMRAYNSIIPHEPVQGPIFEIDMTDAIEFVGKNAAAIVENPFVLNRYRFPGDDADA
ncbi:hypothetical protein BO78DRAFT_421890 [Aspergillus sclerotiicarbonarius CBS 121057]|uniref:Uncharacterized protein n=1 Tax=Aspergillus sclerotiicarbonarius (strain CBS 121057 / IBT 28362) TaxID=1448318 RepID=A0A319E4N3_ASPSB|nr:hypothetical protein BO78DRAFT_421890 [Aspergillus sclerotiicarbonarius CBS 121057]